MNLREQIENQRQLIGGAETSSILNQLLERLEVETNYLKDRLTETSRVARSAASHHNLYR